MKFQSIFTKSIKRTELVLIEPKLSTELMQEQLVKDMKTMKANMEKGKRECYVMNMRLGKIQNELKLLKQTLKMQEMRIDLDEHERRQSII